MSYVLQGLGPSQLSNVDIPNIRVRAVEAVKKVVATMKVGDETDNAGEHAERMISSLNHLIELVEERS